MKEDSGTWKVRRPAVAGQFYPGDPAALERTVVAALAPSPPVAGVLGVVLPHAGYIYSGAVAGETIARIMVPERIIVLGPNHTGAGAPISVYPGGSWWMPFGEVPVDEELVSLLLEEFPQAQAEPSAHRREHSLEVQLPFLHYRRRNTFRFLPVVLSFISGQVCRSGGQALARVIRRAGEPVLIVASSDMNHYEDQAATERKDTAAIEKILALDPDGLLETVVSRRISMCGVIPAAVMLHAALALGAAKADLVRHTTSGEVSGDYGHVVGYAGIIVHR